MRRAVPCKLRVRIHKICVLLCCFDSMYARYMSFLRASPGTNFMPSDSESSNGENFFIFRADEETGEYAD